MTVDNDILDKYRIAGNFRGQKLSLFSQIFRIRES